MEMCLRKKNDSVLWGFFHVKTFCVVFYEWNCTFLLRAVTLAVALARHNMGYVAKCVRPVTDIHTLTVTFLTENRFSSDVTPPELRDWLQVKEERFLLVV
jgi:hypothetical protein